MTNTGLEVIGGFDCHSDMHVAAAISSLGQLLGTSRFSASPDGYQEALAWLHTFGSITAIGVESTGSYGDALARFLSEQGMRVVEVNQPHRHTKNRRGKNDAIDAEAAARKVLSGEASGVPKCSDGVVEAIRQLSIAREGAIKARSAALCQFGDLVVTAPTIVREQFRVRRTLEGKVALCARMRPDVNCPADRGYRGEDRSAEPGSTHPGAR